MIILLCVTCGVSCLLDRIWVYLQVALTEVAENSSTPSFSNRVFALRLPHKLQQAHDESLGLQCQILALPTLGKCQSARRYLLLLFKDS